MRPVPWSAAAVALCPVFALAVGVLRAGAPVRHVEQPPQRDTVETGRDLWLADCAVCHGERGAGSARGPNLDGVGPAGVHFNVATGRMPLSDPDEDATRGPVRYSEAEIGALVAYAATVVDGPGVPEVDLDGADVAAGGEHYRRNCASCHQMAGQGGVLTSGVNVPPLQASDPVTSVEAIRYGPTEMPPFPESVLDEQAVRDVAAYLDELDASRDPGGWSLGHWGPVPEGAVALALGLVPLVVLTRLLGDRNPPTTGDTAER